MNSDNNQTSSVEELYIKEKKKSQIFMLSTTVLAVVLVGYFLMSFNSGDTAISSAAPIGVPGESSLGMRQGGGVPMSEYFYSDGELNTQAINERFANIPAGSQAQFIDRFASRIQSSVDMGEITQDQADSFIDYLYGATSEGEEI